MIYSTNTGISNRIRISASYGIRVIILPLPFVRTSGSVSQSLQASERTGFIRFARWISFRRLCPDFVINLSASPFSYNQGKIKSEILIDNARQYKIPIYYVNQVGAHAELIFDGGSMVVDARGEIKRMKLFEEDFQVIDTEDTSGGQGFSVYNAEDNEVELIHHALVLGIRDYFEKMGLKSAILGFQEVSIQP